MELRLVFRDLKDSHKLHSVQFPFKEIMTITCPLSDHQKRKIKHFLMSMNFDVYLQSCTFAQGLRSGFRPQWHIRALRAGVGVAVIRCMRLIIGDVGTRERRGELKVGRSERSRTSWTAVKGPQCWERKWRLQRCC